jgi:mannose-6-phosphate isomerase-like protein (cupin superfamily)
MSYTARQGEVTATFRPLGEVEHLARPTSSVHFVAPGSVTRRQFGLFRWEMTPRAAGPAPHFHRTFSESFYVLSGRMRLFDGERWVDGTPGDFIYVPKGGIHAFNNGESDEPAAMLILFAPGRARERYFRALAEIGESGRQLSDAQMTAFLAEHDQYMV